MPHSNRVRTLAPDALPNHACRSEQDHLRPFLSQSHDCAYQREWNDHRLQARHWVSVHWCRQAGQTPPVSKVFHSSPQVQNHLSSLRGDQPQSGQRMRGGSDFTDPSRRCRKRSSCSCSALRS